MKLNKFKGRLLIAILFFILVSGAIFFGFTLIRKYSSKLFLLSESIKTLTQESDNSSKTKKLIIENSELFNTLKIHTIIKDDEIPMIIDEIEIYGNDLNLPITINNISLGGESKNKKSSPALSDTQNTKSDTEKEKSPTKKLAIEVSSYGDFSQILKLIKLFENSNYILSVDQYSLKQMLIIPSNKVGETVIFKEQSQNNKNESDTKLKKVWVLNAKLVMSAYKE